MRQGDNSVPSITRLTEPLGLSVPIIQASMLGASSKEIAIAVCEAGGLGSLAAAGLAQGALGAQ